MLRAADAGRRHVELARIGLGVGDELGNGVGRNGRIDLHHQRDDVDATDRDDVREEVEVEFVVQRGVDGVLRVDQQKGIAIARRTGHEFGRDIAGRAGAGLDDELLAELVRHELGDQAGRDVGRTAGGLPNDEFDRMCRIGLGASDTGRGWHQGGGARKLEKAAALNRHAGSPGEIFFLAS